MIFEHEIPSGSKLYFGKSASLKREIEYKTSTILSDLGFEEIVTPVFSYHQHEGFDDKRSLVRLNDSENYEVTLRADSTVDVVRIVTKRLGRTTESKKWFYIQPTVTFPTKEQYQVGAEIIDGDFNEVCQTATKLLSQVDISAVMQISNIKIPHILNEQYGVSLELLKSMHVEDIMATNIEWIEKLVRVNKIEDLDNLDAFPDDIKAELEKIKSAARDVVYENIVIAPLYYAKMRYYDSLTFRMFKNNSLLAMGGVYSVDGVEAAGFALYTDECISMKISRG